MKKRGGDEEMVGEMKWCEVMVLFKRMDRLKVLSLRKMVYVEKMKVERWIF